jgi:hypothetical protein
MYRRYALFVTAILLSLILTEPVWGQEILECQSQDNMRADLKRKFNESPVAQGTSRGVLVELFVSPDGRSWSIIMTGPNGLSCFGGDGADWQNIPVQKGRAS